MSCLWVVLELSLSCLWFVLELSLSCPWVVFLLFHFISFCADKWCIHLQFFFLKKLLGMLMFQKIFMCCWSNRTIIITITLYIGQVPHIGQTGQPCEGLTEDQRQKLQFFDPTSIYSQQTVDNDTIGFFIAKFRKKIHDSWWRFL